jgi:hypothetical protein
MIQARKLFGSAVDVLRRGHGPGTARVISDALIGDKVPKHAQANYRPKAAILVAQRLRSSQPAAMLQHSLPRELPRSFRCALPGGIPEHAG